MPVEEEFNTNCKSKMLSTVYNFRSFLIFYLDIARDFTSRTGPDFNTFSLKAVIIDKDLHLQ